MKRLNEKLAIVTGASSGIGEATARALADLGARLVIGARRLERLAKVRDELRARGARVEAHALDVADPDSIESFLSNVRREHGPADILINNAGLARGFSNVVENDPRDWREMLEANVMGLMHITRAVLPEMIARKSGDIVHLGSVAGLQPYAKGAAYCASKAAVEAFVQALRLELVGTNIRQLVIEPGMVETEFSEVRFHGDSTRAAAVYQGLTPLSSEDIAECIAFVLTRPAHVSIQTMLVMPTAQAAVNVVARHNQT